jgi:nucleolin
MNTHNPAKLFIRNLSWSVTEHDLYNLFGEVGEVLSVKIPTRREDGKPRGFAFVEMASQEIGKQAIQRFNGQMLHNRDLVVDFQDESRSAGGGSFAGGPVKNSKLFVRNINYSVSEQALQSLFQQAGEVYSVKIAMDRETGEPKGFGFIEMASADEAQNAINTLNNTFFEGKEIMIDFQDPNRAKSKPRPSGGYGGGGYGGGGGYNRSGGYGRDRSSGYSDRW